MEEDLRGNHKTQLALATTRGELSTAWVCRNEVPMGSAFRRSRDPKVRRAVEAWRHLVPDRVIGPLVSVVIKAADGVPRVGFA